MSTTESETCHATCLALDEDGVLLRGASGSGKSSLCLALLDANRRDGRHARLVGDDRIILSARHGRLLARPHPSLKGLIEIRGAGPRRLEQFADAAVVRLVVDLVEELPRLPDEVPDSVAVLGLRLPVLHLERRQPREYVIREALAALRQARADHGIVSSQTHPSRLKLIGPKGM